MIYGSVCSGIEAATVAWEGLGWQPAFFAEIDAFPRAVLRQHYPRTPLWGDFTTIRPRFLRRLGIGPIGLLVGGTPCQSFSIAGLRGGLDDDRGNLALEFLRLARRLRPRWVVWENVPGVLSSNRGRDFGAILGGLVELGYGFSYRVLDAQYFGVPQRRRRVFVVGYLGDWRPAAAVLFERHSLSGHPPPRRETGKTAPIIPSRRTAGGGLGTDFDCDGGLVASTLRARDQAKGVDSDCTDTLIAHSLRGEGFDASEDGTGRGTPIVPIPFDTTQITHPENRSKPKPGDICHAISAGAHPPTIAFDCRASSTHMPDPVEDLSPPLRAMPGARPNGGGQLAVALRGRDDGGTAELGVECSHALRASKGGGDKQHILDRTAVRRLTPRECERLQGFPDDYTLIHYRGKPAADGPRYKALGNSMAVVVMQWIGERIQRVQELLDE